MPFMTPTIARTFQATSLAGAVFRQSATSSLGSGRIDTSIGSLYAGGAVSATSLGGIIGVAPPGVTRLIVIASTRSFESAEVYAFGGFAESKANLQLQLEEFSTAAGPTGAPAGKFVFLAQGAPTTVFDASVAPIGINMRIGESNRRDAFIFARVVPGRTYRVWLRSFQLVQAVGVASAASNFTYDFAPLFFSFV
jgi:hypothetical protein